MTQAVESKKPVVDVLGQPLSPAVDVRQLPQVGAVRCDDVMNYVRYESRVFIDSANRRCVLYFDGKKKAAKSEDGTPIKGDRRYYYLTDAGELELIQTLCKARCERRGDHLSDVIGQIQNPNLAVAGSNPAQNMFQSGSETMRNTQTEPPNQTPPPNDGELRFIVGEVNRCRCGFKDFLPWDKECPCCNSKIMWMRE